MGRLVFSARGDYYVVWRLSRMTELRPVRQQAWRAELWAGSVAFADPTITARVTPVDAVHLTDLRTALGYASVQAGAGARSYTDPAGTSGMTATKAAHLSELRNALGCSNRGTTYAE